MPLPIVDEIGEVIKKSLHKSFNEERTYSPFRLSSIGKPVCQLLAEREQMAKEPDGYNQKLRFLYGDIVEAMFMGLLRSAGIPIQTAQGLVTLDIPVVIDGNHTHKTCPGAYDIEVDDQIWDIKSASPFAFKYKFKDFDSLYRDDSFGYVGQLFGYAMAANKRAGGWFVIDKSSGEFKVLTTPENEDTHDEVALKIWDRICSNTQRLQEPGFERSFEDVPETFYKKPTGNRILNSGCTMCSYRYSCWPDMVHREDLNSKAKNKEWTYYTHIAGAQNG